MIVKPRIHHVLADCSNTETRRPKKAYNSRRNAFSARRIYLAQGVDSGEPYRCPRCRRWHLGHSRKAAAR